RQALPVQQPEGRPGPGRDHCLHRKTGNAARCLIPPFKYRRSTDEPSHASRRADSAARAGPSLRSPGPRAFRPGVRYRAPGPRTGPSAGHAGRRAVGSSATRQRTPGPATELRSGHAARRPAGLCRHRAASHGNGHCRFGAGARPAGRPRGTPGAAAGTGPDHAVCPRPWHGPRTGTARPRQPLGLCRRLYSRHRRPACSRLRPGAQPATCRRIAGSCRRSRLGRGRCVDAGKLSHTYPLPPLLAHHERAERCSRTVSPPYFLPFPVCRSSHRTRQIPLKPLPHKASSKLARMLPLVLASRWTNSLLLRTAKEPPTMKRRPLLKSSLAASALMLSGLFPFTLQAAETIKVGILHSLSGTMAISETSLKDMALMTIDEINAKGGVLGKQLEPVVVDPASNWPLF